MFRQDIEFDRAVQEGLHDGHVVWLENGFPVAAGMGSSIHGLDFAAVKRHNLAMTEPILCEGVELHVNILISNTRLVDGDKTRTRYKREVWVRGPAIQLNRPIHGADFPTVLCNLLNKQETNDDVWRVRTEGEWTIVYAGDPKHSQKDVFATMGFKGDPRMKSEYLLMCIGVVLNEPGIVQILNP